VEERKSHASVYGQEEASSFVPGWGMGKCRDREEKGPSRGSFGTSPPVVPEGSTLRKLPSLSFKSRRKPGVEICDLKRLRWAGG